MSDFVGRLEELKLLNNLREKRTASMVVVYGRRRVGKSRLIEEFGRKLKMYTFSGIPPQDHTNNESQLNEFARQMSRQLKIDIPFFSDWGDAFSKLADHSKKGETIIFFDEITWLGSCDPDFLGKLKNTWDMEFKKNDRLILVLCGSVSTWINENILSNTGFYGRISLKLHLKELPLQDCNKFWMLQGNNTSPQEKLKILAVTGGIPKYLEEIKPRYSAEENIRQLCFLNSGLLFNDFDYIFSALVQRKSEIYERAVSLLQETNLEQGELLEKLKMESGGGISSYLDELVISGFLERDYTWNIKSGTISKLSKYRLCDNYLRFYMKYIRPNIQKIKQGQFQNHSLSSLPGWTSIIGLQIENLVLNNRHEIKKHLGIHPDEVIYDNPFFQRKTSRSKGCQIDYMIQTKFGVLYLCEVKFSRNVIKRDIIDEMNQKIKALSVPKNFSIKPVLIHSYEVHDDVADSGFFTKIINLSDFVS